MDALKQLIDNGAFWAFLGVLVTSYYGYKGLILPYTLERKKKKIIENNGNGKGHINVRSLTSFDELKAVVEILQGELERKDKAHTLELNRAYLRIDSLEDENGRLNTEVEKLKDRLHRAHINYE